MRVFRQFLNALLMIVWVATEVMAQTPGSTRLAGRVRDAQGRPVPGAAVVLDPQGPGLERQVTTDATGEFAVLGLSPGLADVIVRASGFREQRFADVLLEVGQSTFLEVDLAARGGHCRERRRARDRFRDAAAIEHESPSCRRRFLAADPVVVDAQRVERECQQMRSRQRPADRS
jgi:hypothetical protein